MVVVGPGCILTSPDLMRSSARHPAGPYGQLAQKRKSGTHCWGREVSTQFKQQFVIAVTASPLVGCVVCSQLDMHVLFIYVKYSVI